MLGAIDVTEKGNEIKGALGVGQIYSLSFIIKKKTTKNNNLRNSMIFVLAKTRDISVINRMKRRNICSGRWMFYLHF